jgi:hypothetical protein
VKKLTEFGLVRPAKQSGTRDRADRRAAHKLVMRAEVRRRNILSAMTDAGEIIKSGAVEKIADLVNKLAGPLAEEAGMMLGDTVRVYRVKNRVGVSLKLVRVESLSATSHQYMPKRSSTDRDFAVNAFRVVEQAIGEHMDGTPVEEPDAGKNPAAVALGKLGGKKGGKARAAKLSGKQRADIAKKAAKARWSKQRESHP